MTNDKCPVWGTPVSGFRNINNDLIEYQSPRTGGAYRLTKTAFHMLHNLDENQRLQLTNWLVSQRYLGVSVPEISSQSLKDTAGTPALSVFERVDMLLRFLGTKTSKIDEYLKFDPKPVILDEILAETGSTELREIQYLSEYCTKQGWTEFRKKPANSIGGFDQGIRILPNGHRRLDELRGKNPESAQCFVAMWFDPSMEQASNEGFLAGIRDAGYKPLRIDKKDHNNKIDDEIIAEIQKSRFVVADFTHGDNGMRGGVYYEAGFAHGLNIPVIFTCREDMIDKTHFDTRQYNHLLWNPNQLGEFRKALRDRISATIGDGPLEQG